MSILAGFTNRDWRQLLKETHYKVERKYLGKAAFILLFSMMNSIYNRKEKRLFAKDYQATQIRQPVFILGHWRNGTTLLHEMMSNDPQFAFPNLFEVSHPHTFLLREPLIEKSAAVAALEKRPMDNMEVNFRSPGEDESALAVLSLRSSILSFMFPRQENFYDRFLTFKNATSEDLERWKQALVLFMQKLTYRYQRPLVMKSPNHTARIKFLLELFPEARFIHIHRNPFTVFQSTLKLYNTAFAAMQLEEPKPSSLHSKILTRYSDMYEAFFEQRELIPDGHLVEVAFSDLEKDKINVLHNIYDRLGLPQFDEKQAGFQKYLARTGGYRKNQYESLPDALQTEITNAWQRNFEEWGYPIHLVG